MHDIDKVMEAIERFECAAQDFVIMGTFEPEAWPDVLEEYKKSKSALVEMWACSNSTPGE